MKPQFQLQTQTKQFITNGVVTGSGKNIPEEPGSHYWTVSGSVSGDDITFDLTYTSGSLVGYVAYFEGTITAEGTMEGTWYDTRFSDCGTWETTCGTAESTFITLGFPEGSDIETVRIIIFDEGLPPCVESGGFELPEALASIPYIAVQVTGTFDGMVQVDIEYDETALGDKAEGDLKIFIFNCVDFNADGTINGKDMKLIKTAIENGLGPDDKDNPAGISFDVNSDDVVDWTDYMIVKEYATEGLILNQGLNGQDQVRLPWIDITTWVDVDNNIIHGETWHFSLFRCR